jgi:dihydrofolate reductase
MMRMSMSVDGFVSDTNGKNDWVFRSSDETSRAWAAEEIGKTGLIIMGRKSFESMAPYWPTAPAPFATPMNVIPKGVFTKKGFAGIAAGADQSPATASWSAARVFDGDLAAEIRKLKDEPGKPIVALGGVGFMRSLIATGLINEYHLYIPPIALGSGLSIFSDLTMPLDLKLMDVKTFPGGIIAKTYSI